MSINIYQERVNRVVANMVKEAMKALVVSDSDSIFYLTGCSIHPGERLLAYVIGDDGTTVLYAPAMFQVGQVPFDVVYYQDHEKPLEDLCRGLKAKNVTCLGVDKDWPARFLLKAMALLESVRMVNGSSAVDLARLSKDEAEAEAMRRASQVNDTVMALVFDRLKQGGLTEIEMSDFIRQAFMANGASGNSFETIACFGPGSSEPHHGCEATELADGPIIIDMGCLVGGYCSDMTRSFYKGDIPADYAHAYQAVLDANLAAIAAVKPGVPLKDVDAAARNLLIDRGYGQYFVHRTGHGIGISVHEYPDVSSVSDAICEVGMVFSIEPGVYLPNNFGIRIEDLVMVTQNGCENLNSYSKALVQI